MCGNIFLCSKISFFCSFFHLGAFVLFREKVGIELCFIVLNKIEMMKRKKKSPLDSVIVSNLFWSSLQTNGIFFKNPEIFNKPKRREKSLRFQPLMSRDFLDIDEFCG